MYSGKEGFFNDHKQKHPFVDCFWKSTERQTDYFIFKTVNLSFFKVDN